MAPRRTHILQRCWDVLALKRGRMDSLSLKVCSTYLNYDSWGKANNLRFLVYRHFQKLCMDNILN